MQLIDTCCTILHQLSAIVRQLDENEFRRPSVTLGATVGQHLRHTVEFFLCLQDGFGSGTVNYDKRLRDELIETDKFAALNALHRIHDFVKSQHGDQALLLEVGYDPGSEACETIETNYYRELVYNIEHTVHHMAIMKIGLREVAPYVQIPSDFGIAISTIRHREAVLDAR